MITEEQEDYLILMNETTTESADTQSIVEISLMAFMGILGICIAVWAILVVLSNSFLQGMVRQYMLIDLANYLMVNVCHLFWGVPCAVWNLDTSLQLPNHLIAGLTFSCVIVGYNPKLFLGINRFLALAFDGRFFGRFERLKYVQYGIMIGLPLVTYLSFMLPHCHQVFLAHGLNYFWVEDECGDQLNFYIVGILAYVYLFFTAIVDFTVFFMLRRRIRAFQSDQRFQTKIQARNLRKEYKLAGQMITDLVTGLILNFSIVGFSSFSSSDLATFLMSTFYWQLCSIVSCLSYAILLREQRVKIKTTSGSSQQISSQKIPPVR